MTKRINPRYLSKVTEAARIADAAWIAGGLDAMHAELASLRRLDADAVIIGELERLYHRQMMRVLPEQRLAPVL